MNRIVVDQGFCSMILVQMLKTSYDSSSVHEPFPVELKESDFIELEKMISEKLDSDGVLTPKQRFELGTSVDASTLKRIFRYEYITEGTLDKRKVKNLDKLCIYLGFTGYQDFLKHAEAHLTCSRLDSIDIDPEREQQDIKMIYTMMELAKEAEFNEYVNVHVQEDDIQRLQVFFHPGDVELIAILFECRRRRKLGSYIDRLDKVSKYEIKNVKITFINDIHALVQTEEEWTLIWKFQQFPLGDVRDEVYQKRTKVHLMEYDKEFFWRFNNNALKDVYKGHFDNADKE